VKERIAAKAIDGLLPDVEELLCLQPNRSDVQKFRQQLMDREQRRHAARDQATAAAESLLASHDYDGAVAALRKLPDALVTANISQICRQAEELAIRTRRLRQEVCAAVANKHFDGLLHLVDAYLSLKPADEEIIRLRQSLVQRQRKQEMSREEAIATARSLMSNHDYDGALGALAKVPMAAIPPEVDLLRSEAEKSAALARNLGEEIHAAVAGKHLDGLLQKVDAYLNLKPADEDIMRLRLKQLATSIERALRNRVIPHGVICAIAGCVFFLLKLKIMAAVSIVIASASLLPPLHNVLINLIMVLPPVDINPGADHIRP
jgi:hypothetical protein